MTERREALPPQPTYIDLLELATINSDLPTFVADQRSWSDAVLAVKEELGEGQPDLLAQIVITQTSKGNHSLQVGEALLSMREWGLLEPVLPRQKTYEIDREDIDSRRAHLSDKLWGYEIIVEKLAESFKGHLSALPVTENKAAFYERIEALEAADATRIMNAYKDAKEAHRRQPPREGGERYFEHLRATALILMDECKIFDPEIIIAALLHDTVEDTDFFGSPEGKTHSEFMVEAHKNILKKDYSPEVAEIVLAVTKPEIDGTEIKDKADIKRVYLEKLANASPEAIVVKMADRLHNLRTLHFRSLADQRKVATDTLKNYVPIFQKGSLEYAAYSDNMLFEIRLLASQYESNATEIQIGRNWVPRPVA